MSISGFFDPLLLLLDDPALLDALLAGEDPGLAPAVPGAPTPASPTSVLPEEPPPTIEELEALLAALEAAARGTLTDALGTDPDLAGDIEAFITAFAALDPSPPEAPAVSLSGEGAWESSAAETVREDWALG